MLNVEKTVEVFNKLSKEYLKLREDLFEKRKAASFTEQIVKRCEVDAAFTINVEVDASTGNPKYSNETQRQAATQKLLDKSDYYTQQKDELRKAQHEADTLQAMCFLKEKEIEMFVNLTKGN